MNPPVNAAVFAVDEKPQIQALNRTAPTLPMLPTTPARATHDYQRNGTIDLFAALDMATGKVITDLRPNHSSAEFIKFLNKINRQVPAELDVHVILDNLSTHKTPAVHKWLLRHRRFHFHFTPTYGSWMNLKGPPSHPPSDGVMQAPPQLDRVKERTRQIECFKNLRDFCQLPRKTSRASPGRRVRSTPTSRLRRGTHQTDPGGQRTSTRAEPLATSGQFCWPRPVSFGRLRAGSHGRRHPDITERCNSRRRPSFTKTRAPQRPRPLRSRRSPRTLATLPGVFILNSNGLRTPQHPRDSEAPLCPLQLETTRTHEPGTVTPLPSPAS